MNRPAGIYTARAKLSCDFAEAYVHDISVLLAIDQHQGGVGGARSICFGAVISVEARSGVLQKVKALIGSSRLACALLLLALVVAPIASIASMTRQASRMVAADVMPCHGAAMADTGVQTGHGQAQEASAGVAKFMAHNCHCSPYCMFAVMNVADGVQTASPVSQSVVPFKPSSIAVASVDPPRATAGLRPVSPRRLRAADERIFSLRPAELQLS